MRVPTKPKGSPRVYRDLRLGVDTVLEKKTVFSDAFSTNRLRGSTLPRLRQDQWI